MSGGSEAKLLNLRLWRLVVTGSVALLVIGSAVVLTNVARYQQDKNYLLHTIAAQSNELEWTKFQLENTERLLANEENKLGFLDQHKTSVQVTAFTGQGTLPVA